VPTSLYKVWGKQFVGNALQSFNQTADGFPDAACGGAMCVTETFRGWPEPSIEDVVWSGVRCAGGCEECSEEFVTGEHAGSFSRAVKQARTD
jgi:hypothetical protein